jgi:Domain of unknown function (DUF1937)
MGFTYLCSPYSHPDRQIRIFRFTRVVREAAKLMAAGEAIFCPIAHSHPIDMALPKIEGHDFWMRQDIPILRHASRVKVLMLEGWQASKGIAHELRIAGDLLIPVVYLQDEEPEQFHDVVVRGNYEGVFNDQD